jgi:uncharacterized protein
MHEPWIERSLQLNFIGDWGQANFHRICSWLCQEVCDRAGTHSRVSIHSMRGGGIEALYEVHDGEADFCITTPAALMSHAATGQSIFSGNAMPDLRALATLPQNDCMILAVAPQFGIRSFAELREKRPPLRIAAGADDGTNFIGYVARRVMEAHGIDEATLRSWGGEYVCDTRPEHSLFRMRDGTVDAVIQEAVLAPWWADVVECGKAVPLTAEPEALARVTNELGLGTRTLPANYWAGWSTPITATDFSDFLLVVRDDMPEDVAHLLTWCLVETRVEIERQYRHLPPNRSPLSYPLMPSAMARTSLPLHPGARRYYEEAGHL